MSQVVILVAETSEQDASDSAYKVRAFDTTYFMNLNQRIVMIGVSFDATIQAGCHKQIKEELVYPLEDD